MINLLSISDTILLHMIKVKLGRWNSPLRKISELLENRGTLKFATGARKFLHCGEVLVSSFASPK